MKFVPVLRTKNAIACHCEVGDRVIVVGLLALNYGHGDVARLLDPDSGDTFAVSLPPWIGWDVDVVLSRLEC